MTDKIDYCELCNDPPLFMVRGSRQEPWRKLCRFHGSTELQSAEIAAVIKKIQDQAVKDSSLWRKQARIDHEEIVRLKAELDEARSISAGRLKILSEKADDAKREWSRAEDALGRLSSLQEDERVARESNDNHYRQLKNAEKDRDALIAGACDLFETLPEVAMLAAKLRIALSNVTK